MKLNKIQYTEKEIESAIAALKDDKLTTRLIAYQLLQGVGSPKAVEAISQGIILDGGEKIYSVYESAIYYNDYTYFIIDNLGEHEEDDELCYSPEFVSSYANKDLAKAEAESLHKSRILEVNIEFDYTDYPYRDSDENFDLAEWCKDNKIPVNEEDDVVRRLQREKNSELLAQLWDLLGYRRLAFVREEIIEKQTVFQRSFREEKVKALVDAVNYGAPGIDLLIAAMNEEALKVRAKAYELLQSLSEPKAKKAIERGIVLNRGDKIYRVYSSAIYYDAEYYVTDYIIDEEEGEEEDSQDEYGNNIEPELVSSHLIRENAEAEAESIHNKRMLEVKAFTLEQEYAVDFNIKAWCQAKKIDFPDRVDEEKDEKGHEFCLYPSDIVMKQLQQEENDELLKELWQLCGLAWLAFVYEEIITEKTYWRS